MEEKIIFRDFEGGPFRDCTRVAAGDVEKRSEKLTCSSKRKRQMNIEAKRGDDVH